MSRRLIAVAVVIVLSLAAWWAYTWARPASPPAATQQSESLDADLAIASSATLSPERFAYLAFRGGGRVESVNVAVGQVVAAGDPLIRLADADLQASVAQAAATLAASQADLAQLRAGARPEEIGQAEAVLAGAKATVAKLRAGARPGEIAQAKAVVAAAQARLGLALAGMRPEQIAVTQALVQQAETTLARAQETYDRVRWVGGETEREARYQRDVAGTALTAAKAQLALVGAPALAHEIAAAQAAVDQAQAQLDLVIAGPTAQEITAAEAQVARAQAQLDLLKAGATKEEIAAAEARVEAARAAADLARSLVVEATIKAPFAGTITDLTVRRGEVATPGQPLVALADLSTLRLQTDDLSETQVAQVHTGQTASITFEALPGATFQGKVTSIASMATLKQGGTNYMVTIILDKLDPALRWGMTAHIEINPAQ